MAAFLDAFAERWPQLSRDNWIVLIYAPGDFDGAIDNEGSEKDC